MYSKMEMYQDVPSDSDKEVPSDFEEEIGPLDNYAASDTPGSRHYPYYSSLSPAHSSLSAPNFPSMCYASFYPPPPPSAMSSSSDASGYEVEVRQDAWFEGYSNFKAFDSKPMAMGVSVWVWEGGSYEPAW